MEDNNKKTKKMNKSEKAVAKAKSNKKTNAKNDETKTSEKKSLKINDGKCCRCTGRNCEKKCSVKKSSNFGKYVARKCGCEFFKYAN